MQDKQINDVIEICKRLEPIIQRFVAKLIDDYDPNVTISVLSNISTGLMANVITMVDVKGGDIEQFGMILMAEVHAKHTACMSKVETEEILLRLRSAGQDTCRPLH